MKIENALITNAEIYIQDHGILTASIYLAYASGVQGFGGFSLYHENHKFNYCGLFIRRVLDTVGVMNWSDLKGKACRVKANWSKVEEIGHIIKDNWFNPTKEFAGR